MKPLAWLVAVAAGCAMVLVVIAVMTDGFGLISSDEPPSNQRTAQDRCEKEVLNRLVSPSSAKLSNVETATSVLDPDSKDLFSLMGDSLKGVDHARIAVWKVSGVVDVPNDVGGTIHDPFTCRAYFVDGDFTDTLVLFEHDH